jgi:SnoaL-like domain
MSAPRPADLADRIAIADVISRIGFSIDQQEWAGAESALADEIISDYSQLFGGEAQRQTREELIGSWRAALPGFHANQHMINTIEVLLTAPDQARSRSYVRATHRYENDLWVVGGIYAHQLMRSPTGWRVTSVHFTLAYEEGDRRLIGLAVERAKTLV